VVHPAARQAVQLLERGHALGVQGVHHRRALLAHARQDGPPLAGDEALERQPLPLQRVQHVRPLARHQRPGVHERGHRVRLEQPREV
jgi:hypothetical protein